jgi:hypothetical protein
MDMFMLLNPVHSAVVSHRVYCFQDIIVLTQSMTRLQMFLSKSRNPVMTPILLEADIFAYI